MRTESEHTINSHEQLAQPKEGRTLMPIGTELFLSGVRPETNLPNDIITHPRLVEQARDRRNLHQLFDNIFTSIPQPNMDITQAVKENRLGETTVVSLWDGVSNFLEQDENNVRLLLYLPFEILPNLKTTEDQSDAMKGAGLRFADVYRKGWVRLLHETESRANFVDGDILEPGLPQPERISKAGHLTPELLEKGIIETSDVMFLLEAMQDKELLRSLAEGTTVAHDRGLIDESLWQKANAMIEEKVGNPRLLSEKNADLYDPNSLKISPERAHWLHKVQAEQEERVQADQLAQTINSDTDIEALLAQNMDRLTLLGVMKAGELLHKNDSTAARDFSAQAEKSLRYALQTNDASTKDVLIGGLQRWARLGIVDNEALQKYGIKLRDVSLPSQFSEKELAEEFNNFLSAAKKIKDHPALSKALYPTFLVFGSRMKGYAETQADVDAAIFFKPDAQFADREKMLQTLKADFPELANVDKFLEYWTMKEDGKLQFKNPTEDTRIFVGEEEIHFFMGGAWIGAGEEWMQLRHDLLKPYLDLSRFGKQKDNVRQQLVGQIELDVLQYRLMHKGYGKLYPQIDRSEKETQNADLIDWKSDFWDPGYRRVATKLFLSRVFLPDLS